MEGLLRPPPVPQQGVAAGSRGSRVSTGAAAHLAAGQTSHLLIPGPWSRRPAAACQVLHRQLPAPGAASHCGPSRSATHAAVMAEPLWHSRRICDPITRQPLAWHHWAGLGVIRVGDLRELAVAAPGDLPATVREGLPTIMRALPEAWAAALRSVAPPAQWLVSPDAADRRVWSRAPDGSLGASHVVSPTGALMPAPPGAAGGVLPDGLQPALVRPWAPGRPWHPRSRSAAATPTPTAAGAEAAAPQPPPPRRRRHPATWWAAGSQAPWTTALGV